MGIAEALCESGAKPVPWEEARKQIAGDATTMPAQSVEFHDEALNAGRAQRHRHTFLKLICSAIRQFLQTG